MLKLKRVRIKYFFEGLSISIGLIILLLNFLFIAPVIPAFVPIFNVIGGIIAVVPPLMIFYRRYRATKESEQQFIIFIMDLTDSMNTGMTLPMALGYCSKKDYGILTKSIQDLASQVDWGIPFKKALKIFSERSPSKSIKRAVTTIIETYRVGGKIGETLKEIGSSLITIDKIKKERTTSVHAQIVTSYLIYFIFIFILVILQIVLIPALEIPASMTAVPGTAEAAPAVSQEIYTQSFVNFIIIQGLFAGLVTGKMAEGSIVAGFKHSVLLIAVGYAIFSLAIQFPIKIV